MALKKHYSGGLMIIDIILFFLTSGAWIIVVILRELYRMNKRKTC